MKIGIDGTPLTIPFPCGTKHYAEQLIRSLAEVDKNNRYTIFASKKIHIPQQANFAFKKIPSFFPILRRQLFLAPVVKRESVDVFHYLDPFGSVFFRHPNIITTVHDVNLDYTYPKKSRYVLNRYYCEVVRKAVITNSKVIIAGSSFTAKELREYLRTAGKSVYTIVVPYAVSNNFRRLPQKERSHENYFLCLGDFTPRKNIPSVLEAFSLLPQEMQAEYKLKVVVSSSLPKISLLRKAREFGIIPRLEILENVPLQSLVHLYNGSAAFLYPSLYEGFGIPILEAMACGCPVITANRSATKDVGGSAAYLVDPESVVEIASAMKAIVGQPKLKKLLRQKGIERAKLFSWKLTAQRTLEIYEKTFKT